ncbi:hypothetical protein [Synergistes jonesii]|uniref:Uncharacterized protein n=1 Tax=Synergistes jonesii TaxID=2754 RepID=A0A073IQ52_9BACT|nr:hypothetical protein [Synergistes jonesii]KEJ91715.1 hypothetical protein EH55_07000 [Synergistes jonesii]
MSKGDAFDFAAKILQTGEGTDREKFLARAVVRRTNEVTELEETLDYSAADIAELKETIKEQDALLKRQGVELDDASMELSELKDKLRWRKQSEEPAPTGAKVIIRYQDYDEIKMRIACMEDMLDPDGEPCYADICWRPLDLPEEGKQ